VALFTDPITIKRAPLVEDAYGRRRDWGQAVTVWSGIGAALPYRRVAGSASPDRETSHQRVTVYLSGDADIDSADQLTIRGQVYTLDGPPWIWRLGSRVYVQMDARRVDK